MARIRLNHLAPLVALLVLAGTASLATAAEDGGGPNLFWQGIESLGLGIWTILVFVILLIVLRWKAWGPMMQGLHNREESIHGSIRDAQRLREEAEQHRREWDRKMAQVAEEVRGIHEEARKRAEANANDLLAKARTDIGAERDRLRREIELAKDQALQELWSRTATLVTEVSAKAIRRQINPDDQRRLVEDALQELSRASGPGRNSG